MTVRPPRALEGPIERDRLGWKEYVTVDGKRVRYWIWDALDLIVRNVPEGTRVRISLEVLVDD